MRNAFFAVIGIILLFVVAITGCTEVNEVDNTPITYTLNDAKAACINLCLDEKSKGTDLSSGPCLSNSIVDDWVCDVAHDPRDVADSLPANQCEDFMKQTAHNFVELNENCELIQYYEKE